jgi:predicted nucleotidyltransferase
VNTRVRARIKKIVTALKRYDPERVILFGSAARGEADAYSDMDIVVIKETSERFLDRLGRVYDLIEGDFALDALV